MHQARCGTLRQHRQDTAVNTLHTAAAQHSGGAVLAAMRAGIGFPIFCACALLRSASAFVPGNRVGWKQHTRYRPDSRQSCPVETRGNVAYYRRRARMPHMMFDTLTEKMAGVAELLQGKKKITAARSACRDSCVEHGLQQCYYSYSGQDYCSTWPLRALLKHLTPRVLAFKDTHSDTSETIA